MNAKATLLVLAVAYFTDGVVGQNIDGIINCAKQFGFPTGVINSIRKNPMMIPEMTSSQLCYGKCFLDALNLTNGNSFIPTNVMNSLPIMNIVRSATQMRSRMNMSANQPMLLALMNGCNQDGTGDCMMMASIARCVTTMIRPSMILQFMNLMSAMNPGLSG